MFKAQKFFILSILFVPQLSSANTTDNQSILLNWKLQVIHLVTKYEKPKCLKFYWTPDGCPESESAKKFKQICKSNPSASGKSFKVDIVQNILPKINWYKERRGYLSFKKTLLKSNPEGALDISKEINKHLEISQNYALNNDNIILSSNSSQKVNSTYLEYDGNKMWLNRKVLSGEPLKEVDEEMFEAPTLHSFVITRPLCPKNDLLVRIRKNIKEKIDFAYVMSVFTPVIEN